MYTLPATIQHCTIFAKFRKYFAFIVFARANQNILDPDPGKICGMHGSIRDLRNAYLHYTHAWLYFARAFN